MIETTVSEASLAEGAALAGKRPRPTNPFVRFERADVERSIPEVFEEKLSSFGDRVAIHDDDQSIVHEELNERANRLAHRILDDCGDASETVCLLVRDQSVEVIVAILGVLKAGKIYVPLDPAFIRTERAGRILEDTGARLIVTDAANLAAAKELAGGNRRVVNLDSLPEGPSCRNPRIALKPETPACLLYTSGSTGRPNGVIHTHRTVLRNNRHYINEHRLGVEDRLLQLSSAGVVGGMRTLFGALFSGAVIVPYNARERGVAKLAAFLGERRITGIQTVPTVYRHLIQSLRGDERLDAIRIVRLGGEPILARDLELFKKTFPSDALFINGLGTTEVGTISTYFADKDTELETACLPVGWPVDDVEALILDKDGEQVANGQTGEIAARGEFLAAGYWGQPELTAAAFKQCPRDSRKRIYRTGDLGHFLPDGSLMHLGRKDFQVKVRGFRVEVGEVQEALLDFSRVKQAVVVGREGDGGDHELAAYVVMEGKSSATAAELRRFLEPKLPGYMIPTRFVMLDELPLTATGKIDRRALPEPSLVLSVGEDSGEAPQGEVEIALAEIWKKLLHRTSVGRCENFFDLGGDSLRAASLFDEIESAFGCALPPALLVDSPTIEKLAHSIGGSAGLGEGLVALQTQGVRPPLYLIPQAGGDGVIYRDLPALMGVDQPLFGLRPPGLSGPSSFDESVRELAVGYVSEIQNFQPEGAIHLGGFSFGGSVAWEVACELSERGRRVAFLGLFDSYGPGIGNAALSGGWNPWRRSRRFFYRMAQKARLHAAVLAGLEGNEKSAYLRKRAAGKWKALFRVLKARKKRPKEELLDKIYQRDLAALRTWRPRTLAGDATLFRCAIHFHPEQTRSLDLGWEQYCGGRLNVVNLPGYHSLMFTAPFAKQVVGELTECLEDCGAESDEN
ncbi:MAG: amino acid adenylation domain-containing protein [Verrucomicrobiia bacterium]